MRILFVGDVFGQAGRRIVREHLAPLVEQQGIDLVIVNAENAAGGFGLTPAIADELFDQGVHVLTTGNHVWDKREIIEYMQSVPETSQERPRRVIRPANYVAGTPGHGVFQGELPSGQSYAVIAMVRNPDQNGHVLLLAGANAEGTEAAGLFLAQEVGRQKLKSALGLDRDPAAPVYFEALLRIEAVGGSPSSAGIVAIRILKP